MKVNEIANLIDKWYKINKRSFPWRNESNPYFIWLSEIILQQTRAEQGIPYFNNFVLKYPNLKSLAEANEQEVLSLWQGLGYYSRARNLLKTAKIVQDKYNGNLPDNYKVLLELPGIGKYTASAISSIAYGEKQAVVDGNVYRFLSRLFEIEECIDLPNTYYLFNDIALNLMGQNAPGDFNQALMEIGSTVCTPKKPKCADCPVNMFCLAKANNSIEKYPVRCKNSKIKELNFNYFVIINQENEIAMSKRPEKGIWANLYEFPLVETENKINSFDELPNSFEFFKNAKFIHSIELKPHILSHRKINSVFWLFELNDGQNSNFTFYNKKEIENLPKPTLIVNFLEKMYLNFEYL